MCLQSCRILALMVLVSMFWGAAEVKAETLVMTDGSRIECKILKRNAQLITIEVMEGGKLKEKIIIAAKVAKIEEDSPQPAPDKPAPDSPAPDKPAPADPSKANTGSTYCIIPIRRTLGVDVTAPLLDKAIKACIAEKPEFIVFEFECDGSMEDASLKVAMQLAAWEEEPGPKPKMLAFVKGNAHHAGAIAVLSVRHIYMSPEATVGAVKPWIEKSGGTLSPEDNRRQGSRIICNSAVAIAGHDPWFAAAMIDADHRLTATWNLFGKIKIHVDAPDDAQGKSQLIVEKGKLLMLTAESAKSLRVAQGIAKDYDELGKLLNRPNWRSASDTGTKIMEAHVRVMEAATADYERSLKRVKDFQAAVNKAAGGNISNLEPAALSARNALTQIQKLALEHSFLKPRIETDIPGGAAAAINQVEQLIMQIREARKSRIK